MKSVLSYGVIFTSMLAACGDAQENLATLQVSTNATQAHLQQGAGPLDFQAAGNAYYQIQDYGSELRNNKNYLVEVLRGQQANLSEQVLIVAMAMQETNHMDPSERDGSKDGTPSANISILNLNIDLLNMAGYAGTDNGAAMNAWNNLGEPVWFLRHAVDIWGLGPTLNFQRGGRTAFEDGISYGAADYRNSIATIYSAIANDMSLLTDSRRVVVDLDHVFR